MERTTGKVYSEQDVREMLSGVDELYASKGKTVKRFDLKRGMPPHEDFDRLILSRKGVLRAPALKMGRMLVVGFNEDLYSALFTRE